MNILLHIAVFIIASTLGTIVYGLNTDIFFGILMGLQATIFLYLCLANKDKDTTKK